MAKKNSEIFEPNKSSSSICSEEDELFEYIHNNEVEKINGMLNKKRILPIWNYKSIENHNSTVLNISAYKKSLIITKILITYCKNKEPTKLVDFVNLPNDQGITPLHYASFGGDIEIINLLIENGADINKVTDRKLNVIHYCSQGNKPNSLMYFYFLLKDKNEDNKFALLLEKDGNGSTPLHWAVYSLAEDFLLYYINLDILCPFY